jgi:hypothetical protein
MKWENCGHLIWVDGSGDKENEVYKHKQSNHSLYCPAKNLNILGLLSVVVFVYGLSFDQTRIDPIKSAHFRSILNSSYAFRARNHYMSEVVSLKIIPAGEFRLGKGKKPTLQISGRTRSLVD